MLPIRDSPEEATNILSSTASLAPTLPTLELRSALLDDDDDNDGDDCEFWNVARSKRGGIKRNQLGG